MVNMPAKFEYSFDKKTGILYKIYYGDITLLDITSSWDRAIKENIIPKETIGFILDYRNASFNIPIKETSGIAGYYKQHLEIFGNKKIAILTDTPDRIRIPTLVELLDEGYISRPFSTMNAAIAWVSV
jgi:hypothetical protein